MLLKRPKHYILSVYYAQFKDWLASPWMSRLTDNEWYSVRTRRQGLALFIRNHIL